MKEWLPISISVFALAVSCTTFYFQFFYRPRRVRVVTMPMKRDGSISFGICNAGKESVYVTGLNVNYAIHFPNGSAKFSPVGVVNLQGKIIQPGSITEFSYNLQPPTQDFLSEAHEVFDNIGVGLQKKLDIYVYIQLAFPDGAIYSKQFKVGEYLKMENGIGNTVDGININLLKEALPVLKRGRKKFFSRNVRIDA